MTLRWKFAVVALAVPLLACGAAQAADVPIVKAPVKAPVYVIYNWTGFYVGANVGYSWGPWSSTGFVSGATLASPTGGSASPKLKGWLGGLQAGYNWQFDKIVLGVEGDFQITGEKDSIGWTLPNPNLIVAGAGIPITNEWKFPWFGTLRGRLGYASDKWLFYGTVGAAYGKAKSDLTTPAGTTSDSKSKLGWAAGAGIEWAFTRSWSAKVEYLYLDLGSATFFETTATPVTSKVRDHILRAGVNYRFDGPLSVRF